MSKKFQKKLSNVKRLMRHSFFPGTGKTILGLWGENQVKKLTNLGQEIVVMRMG